MTVRCVMHVNNNRAIMSVHGTFVSFHGGGPDALCSQSCQGFWTGSGAEIVTAMWTGGREETPSPL